MNHWQEIGCCGRDGHLSRAIWFPQSTAGEDKEIFEVMKRDKTVCIHKVMLEAFTLPNMDMSSVNVLGTMKSCEKKCVNCCCVLCLCCTNCKNKCQCNVK